MKLVQRLTARNIAQSAGAVEYTDCISADGVRSPRNECPGYDIKQSDGEASTLEF